MIYLADKHVQECKREVKGQFVYNERRLPCIVVSLKSNFWLGSLDEEVTSTGEALGDECSDPSCADVVVSVLTVVGDHKGEWDFEDIQLGSSSEHEQSRRVLSNIRRLVTRAGFLAPDNDLGVLCLAKCSLHDSPTLMELRRVLTSKRAEGK